MGLLQRLLAPIPEPRDIGTQTLALVVWPAGAGGGNWLVEGLGVGGQRLPALASLGDVLPPWWHVGEAGASPLGTSEKWGHELRPLGKEVFLAEQVRPVLASWQLSPRSFQPPWRERCDFDISGKWKGKGAASAESPSPGERARASASVKRVEILDAKTREKLCFLDKVEPHATIAEIKNLFTKTHPQWYPARQSLRLDPKGKSLKDEDVLQKLPVGTTATLYFRDLGAQISWVTVFLTEYAGPLFIYLLFYFRVPFIYGHKYDFTSSRHTVVHLACICHSFHYIKRLLETLFVHRFSHGTMPLRNIFKNCTYYWGFAAWMAYYINHPLYTPPTYGAQQVKLALAIFVICQLGNFSIHMALRDLRPAGSKTRKIPYPTKNPFTWLFLLVSCPNYTYEVGSWIGFAIMTQCLPVALFSLVGFTQMTIWAKGKHRSYLKEFRDYPPLRMPIIPFLL
ncbi:very-long-chain enoyl-CoA reductase isoform X1 [Leopardus geoffroyi]|uniref:very-long-chain enoyl-CoA reductase isoform X1 n=1 Tax=Leopardus geoffroyi TaxID=46844 RepID=UPI001E2657AC|nr:very-long-chain enoyl-CoA reductase isoform X1 [Leopardus geoffroyi]